MNCCDVENNTGLVGSDEMGCPVAPFDRKSPIVCPKPRRAGYFVNNPTVMYPRRHMRSLEELCDSKLGADILDLIQGKEANDPPSPPYFCGSPPSRVSNPLVLDSLFRDGKASPKSPIANPSSSSPAPSPSSRKGGCTRNKFGLKQATVRVEGFDCLGRDCPASGITAVA